MTADEQRAWELDPYLVDPWADHDSGADLPRCPECGCLVDDHRQPADVLAEDALEEARAVLRGYGPLSTCGDCGECTWEKEDER